MEDQFIKVGNFLRVNWSKSPAEFRRWWNRYYRNGPLEKAAAYYGWLAAMEEMKKKEQERVVEDKEDRKRGPYEKHI